MVERQIAARGICDPLILSAFLEVPRHLFVPDGCDLVDSYGDFPLPVGLGQTVSQPFIVALMIEMMDLGPGSRILEIGTGSGYQTAILARMGFSVVSLEVLVPLAVRAARNLRLVAPDADVRVIAADGRRGWPPAAPYEGVIVSAAASSVPPALSEQLAVGGRMVIPVGPRDGTQQLLTVTRLLSGTETRPGELVRFVPLV